MSRRAARRVVKAAALSLLLGLVATWVVAWGSALSWQPNRGPIMYHTGSESPYRVFVRWTCPGGESILLSHVTDYTAEEQSRQWDRLQIGAADRRFGDPPVLAAELIAAEPDGPFRHVVSLAARGWPWRALRWVSEMDRSYYAGQPTSFPNGAWCPSAVFDNHHWPPPPPIARGCIQVTSDRGRFTTGKRLPLIPRWPGLIADTLFFAGALGAMHQISAFSRRWRRRRGGRCASCGYDLTGISGPCPECGVERRGCGEGGGA